jgi:hypothetical protein
VPFYFYGSVPKEADGKTPLAASGVNGFQLESATRLFCSTESFLARQSQIVNRKSHDSGHGH